MARHCFSEPGKVNAAATARGQSHNEDYARHLGRLGEACRLIGAAEMQSITGTRWYRCGLYTAGTTMLQPAAYVRGLARGLADTPGVSLFEDSPVTTLESREGAGRRSRRRGE